MNPQNFLELLAALENGKLALNDFQEEVAVVSWSSDETQDPTLRELLGATELMLAEYTNGEQSEADLRAALRALQVRAEYMMHVSFFAPTTYTTGTGSGALASATVVVQADSAPARATIAWGDTELLGAHG